MPALMAAVCLLTRPGAAATPPPWQRTEAREPCAGFDPLRVPYFGDLHVHTGFSHDAYLWGTRVTPADAYTFARGGAITIPDRTGALTRSVRLERTLDFTAVTDHAEFLGEVRVCTTPGTPGYDDELCRKLREIEDHATEEWDFLLWGLPLGVPVGLPAPHAFCALPGVDCAAAGISAWQDVQAAAEEAYDRTAACAFTTFVGYENTASPLGSHLHRNVIFRNERVPAVPASYLLTGDGGSAQALWAALERDCLGAGNGCEAVTIPHNSNLSGGLRWPDPMDAADARRHQLREPLVEIFQHKAGSECRFDRIVGLGADTNDELCTFEQDPRAKQGPFPRPPIAEYPRRNLVRNTLKDGLFFEQALGVNPFRLGFVGSTDTHNATAGSTEESGWAGHQGYSDADRDGRLSPEQFEAGRIRFNPGGLAVVWAEENSRDGLFAALARRETYATSGTRPVVRFFAGELPDLACGRAAFVERAYRGGMPMGGEIGAVRGRRSPRFAVLAVKDPGTAGSPGTALQRVQVVKGWVDAGGQTHERVFDVAGDAGNGATVDPATCRPVGAGASELCAIWSDPEFDPSQHAFYYARVLENPTCRWSTLACKAEGVDPFAPHCAVQAEGKSPALANCCLDETNDPFLSPVIQERAWTSPIWYRPEGIAAVRGGVRFGRSAGRDVLKLAVRIRRLPPEVDPQAADLTLRVTDDDEIHAVTIPPGTLVPRAAGRFTHRDAGGGLAGLVMASLRVRPSGQGALKLATGPMDLGRADRTDHMVTVTLGTGTYEVVHTRRWTAAARRLSPPAR
jgi:hypothetical protein